MAKTFVHRIGLGLRARRFRHRSQQKRKNQTMLRLKMPRPNPLLKKDSILSENPKMSSHPTGLKSQLQLETVERVKPRRNLRKLLLSSSNREVTTPLPIKEVTPERVKTSMLPTGSQPTPKTRMLMKLELRDMN